MDITQIPSQLASLVVFHHLAEEPVLVRLNDFLHSESRPADEQIAAYSAFVRELFAHGCDFGAWLLDTAAADENPYVIARARGKSMPPVLAACAKAELEILSALSALSADDLCSRIPYSGYLPRFGRAPLDFPAEYERRMSDVQRSGYGIFAHNIMFDVRDGVLCPLRSPDSTDIHALIGYHRERRQVLDNTLSLLRGLPAANVLLCGDAGTGKSTTVKAIANLLAPQGLRLVEMRKEQLRSIPSVMEQLRGSPLKFILFIDDLSFSRNDDNFGALKAILEGSATARAENVAIYATSNRRHLVRESFSDRGDDDVHRQDTMQELLSLSDRFGLTVLFSRPDKALYLEIVRELAQRKGIVLPPEELDRQAEAFALRRGGRSARAAEQLTDSLLSAAP